MDMSLSKLWEMVDDREAWDSLQSMGLQRVGHDLATEQHNGKEIIVEKNDLSNPAIPGVGSRNWMQLFEDVLPKQLDKLTYDIIRELWFRLWLYLDYSFCYWTLSENRDNLFLPRESAEKDCLKISVSTIFWFVFWSAFYKLQLSQLWALLCWFCGFQLNFKGSCTGCKGSLVRQGVAEKPRNSSACLKNILAGYRILKMKYKALRRKKVFLGDIHLSTIFVRF